MQKTQKTKINWPPFAWPLAGYIAALLCGVGLVYFWRVIFMLEGLAVVPFTLGVLGVISVIYAAALLIFKTTKNNISLRAALCVFVVGLLFVFATAPMQVPDEGVHYLRAYAISTGRFDYNYQSTYPEDVKWLFHSLGSPIDGSINLNHSITYQGKELAGAAIAEYTQGLQSGEAAPNYTGEPIMFMLLPFLPSALGMVIGRVLGFSALGLMYAGRIANLAVYAALCYKCFKNCDKFRGVFIGVALLPLSLFLGASCSYDSLMLPLCYLIVSYFCKNSITSRDIVVLGLATVMVTYIKPMNVVLAAVLLLIPKARWKSKFHPWLAFGAILAGALCFYLVMGKVDGIGVLAKNWPQEELNAARTAGASQLEQLGFVAKNPFVVLSILLNSFMENEAFVFGMGTLGWMDLTLPLIGGLSVLSLSAASALGIQQKEDTRPGGAVGLLLAAGLYAGAVMGGMYVLETAVGAIRISGLQPRYFLPAMLLVFMLLSILLGKAVRPRLAGGPEKARTEHITLYIALALAVLCAVLLFQSYYVGQWIPRVTEDGYKLVNMFGWRIP